MTGSSRKIVLLERRRGCENRGPAPCSVRKHKDSQNGVRERFSEVQLLQKASIKYCIDRVRQNNCLFSSGEEDVKIEDLHLAVFENTRTVEMVCESA